MEATAVKFNRPLFIERAKDYFQTIYGIVVNGELSTINPDYLNDYVGYLAGMHCLSNGDNYFTISYEQRGVPDWADRNGKIHIKQDNWIRNIQKKCIQKLNLTYEIISLDIEEDELDNYLNEDNLILNDNFLNELDNQQGSLGEDDGLPF